MATHPSGHEEVIHMDAVSFRYRVTDRYTTFKEYVIRRLQRRVRSHEFWALRDIDISIGRGEVIGLIGRNGAGKSTLLRLIAGVLLPTSGRVVVRSWPVSPMLELGAGFHPDLTGRENVYLNGTLIGRTKREIDERVDWIISFSELNDVIEMPLRTYSSGMQARLGFAVATAWHPKVLLVDEVLAVGDEAFRKKCEERIQQFRAELATVVLVSHQLTQIREICTRAVWLDAGRIRAMGDPDDVVAAYEATAI